MNTNEILTTILDRLTGVEGKLDNQGQQFILLDKKWTAWNKDLINWIPK